MVNLNNKRSKKRKYFLENRIEFILWKSRFLVLIPVLIGLFIFLFLLFIVLLKTYHLFIDFIKIGLSEKLLSDVISILDVSLLALIILMFSWGIYELFVDEIDVDDDHLSKAKTLIVEDIDELKEKVGKVIIILLIVWLFKQMLLNSPKNDTEIIILALSILTLALSLKFISGKK